VHGGIVQWILAICYAQETGTLLKGLGAETWYALKFLA
jgi:hypothetical protein